jgi:RNA polymerase sigma-70 factor (ECF subfamily)
MSLPMLSAPPLVPDADLLAEVAAGDERALRELMRRHAEPLRARAMRMLDDPCLADEVVQDVFLAMVRWGAQFRRDANVRTWLYAIAINRCRTVRRRNARLAIHHVTELDTEFADSAPNPHDDAEARDMRERVAHAIAALPKRMREVAMLRFDGHSYPEIAARQGCTRGTVAAYLHRALKRIGDDLRAGGVTSASL